MNSIENSLVRILVDNRPRKTCVSCGMLLPKRKRRYCSKECKDRLIFALRWLKNLLLALNTNYATFSFSERFLIVNVMPFRSKDVYSFFYQRNSGRSPAEDLKTMCLDLSQEWYQKNQQTRCRPLTSLHMLNQWKKGLVTRETMRPVIKRIRTNFQQQLKCLKLSLEDVSSEKSEESVKAAYRREALKTHPDKGGDSSQFRAVSDAYQEVTAWLKNPSFVFVRGIEGKWSYDGTSCKWRTPL